MDNYTTISYCYQLNKPCNYLLKFEWKIGLIPEISEIFDKILKSQVHILAFKGIKNLNHSKCKTKKCRIRKYIFVQIFVLDSGKFFR